MAISASAPPTARVTQSTTGDVATDRDARFAVVAVADFPVVVPGVVAVVRALARETERLRGPLPVERVLRGAIDRGRGAGPALFAGDGAAAAVVGVGRVCVGARGSGVGVAIGSGGGATVS
jgi:hypothetical protein